MHPAGAQGCEVAAIVSLTQLFVIGIGLDLAGAVLLARGPLVSMQAISRRVLDPVGANVPIRAPEIVAEARERASARVGLWVLGCGFAVQFVGYALTLGGVKSETGAVELVVGLALAAVACAGAFVLEARLRPRLVRDTVLYVARSAEHRYQSDAGAMFLLEAAVQLGQPSAPQEPFEEFIRRVYDAPVWLVDGTWSLLEMTASEDTP